ncbi:putative glutaminase [Aspergillus undulatus]|uniref:putative glutaminase n=1 Tax=Aspergillus undulatus TaxID=1810928 RepID=UPI003CCE4A55
MQFYLTSVLAILLPATSVFSLSPEKHDAVDYRPTRPPSYPLAVRSPYLSTWMPSDQVQALPFAESQFWAGQNLTWSVMARVDNQAYSLMGITNPGTKIRPATVRTAEYTATHSIFTLTAGSVIFMLDFFSPISPSNYLRQSLPFSYLTVTACNADEDRIQIFTSIDGRWAGNPQHAVSNFHRQDDILAYAIGVDNAVPYAENSDMATWGEAILSSRDKSQSRITYSSGKRGEVRAQFVNHGKLTSNNDTWAPGGIVALSHDLGTVSGEQSAHFAIGYVREEAINYLGKPYTGYYRAEYPDTHKALSHFFDDYPAAVLESKIVDAEMTIQAALAGGNKYADIVTLSARQAWGGIDLTIPNDSLDTKDVLAFVKELSSNGNLNTVDVIMPAFPIYYVADPDYIRLLLEPMMRYLAADRWHLPYTIHDMGSHYPNATGHDDQNAEPMPIEECGNLLVLVLAYVRATDDTAWADQYMDILRKYADYLVENSIDIALQLSSNDAAGPLANETNLAIKAAVGLKAFGELSGLSNYSRIGEEHADLFFTQGLGTDESKSHFVLQYPDEPNSWKTPYNLYPDVLLDLGTFPEEAYQMGDTFFHDVRGDYGVPLDNRQDWAKSDWNMWLAGTFDDTNTRSEFIDDLWAFMSNGKHGWPFSDRYVATSAKGGEPGVPVLCRARPTVGGHFALMALQGPKSLQNAVARKLEGASSEREDL